MSLKFCAKTASSYTAALRDKCGGTCPAAAVADTSTGMISVYASTDHDRLLNIKQLVALTNHTGDRRLLDYINRLCDREKDFSPNGSIEAIHAGAAGLSREHGEAFATIIDALADRQVKPREKHAMLKELMDVRDAVDNLIDTIGASITRGEETTLEKESQ